MSTLPVNNIVRSNAPKSIFESAKSVISSAVSFNQGDLIYFDTSAFLMKPITLTAQAASLLGVAKQTIVSGKVASPYQGTAVDASLAIEDIAGAVYGVTASMILKTSDAFNPGDKVYATTVSSQTVSSVDPGDGMYIGIYQGKAIGSAVAGSKGDILIGARYGVGAFSV